MTFGPSGHGHGPQKPLFLTLETPKYFKKTKNRFRVIFQTVGLGNYRIREISFWGKDECGTIMKMRPIILEKLGDGTKI